MGYEELRLSVDNEFLDGDGSLLLDDDDESIGVIDSSEIAKRIAACVNACAGISTDRLESAGDEIAKHFLNCETTF